MIKTLRKSEVQVHIFRLQRLYFLAFMILWIVHAYTVGPFS
jgi:hypothetical protein